MLNIKKYAMQEFFRKYAVLVTATIMLLISAFATGGTYLTASNMLNVGERAAGIGIVALGQMLVILTGGIDLSVSGILAVGYCVTDLLSKNPAIPMPLVILLMIIATTLCGAINGFLVSRTKVPPFMITLGTYMAFQSLAYVLSQAAKLNFQDQQKWMISNLGLSGTAGRLFPSLLWIAVSVLVILLLAYSRFGKNIYQTGGRELAAQMSGINTRRIKFLVYTLAGTLCGIAALTLEFRMRFLNVSSTTSLQIASIAAVIIGGTSLKGGEGNVYGTFVGAFIMASLDNLMNLVGIGVYSQDIVKGGVLLTFMSLTTLFSRKRGASEQG